MSSFHAPRFGTDGIRGRAGTPPMDRETMTRIGAAMGLWLQHTGEEQKRVLVGHDGRVSAPWILECLVHGLSGAEVSVSEIGLCTTPALAYLTRVEPFHAGIMISASHNPAHDNGIKIFAGDGTKLPSTAESEIEELTARISSGQHPSGRAKPRENLLNGYLQHLADSFPTLDLTGKRIAVDAAHGGGSRLAPSALRAFGAEVLTIGCAPDGQNINDGVGALHPEHLGAFVAEHGADLGLCLDGDGDRGLFVDENGTVRDGDDILALFGRSLHARGALPHDTVVATVMSNLGLHKALEAAGVALEITPVGDRHVTQRMREGGFGLGGEQSGHILFDGAGALTGDGLFTALNLLSLPELADGPASKAFGAFRRYPQVLQNVAIGRKPELESVPELMAGVRAVEEALAGDGRVLLRYSGTEPLCRVMVEGPSADVVQRHVDYLVGIVQTTLT